MNDSRAGETAARYIHLFNELGKLGKAGFAHMIDSASEEDMNELCTVLDILMPQIDRTKRSLGVQP